MEHTLMSRFNEFDTGALNCEALCTKKKAELKAHWSKSKANVYRWSRMNPEKKFIFMFRHFRIVSPQWRPWILAATSRENLRSDGRCSVTHYKSNPFACSTALYLLGIDGIDAHPARRSYWGTFLCVFDLPVHVVSLTEIVIYAVTHFHL